MRGLDAWLDPILSDSVLSLTNEHRENLRSVVRFGSTTEFIKYDTDVDVLLLFDELPHRRSRHHLLDAWETETNKRLGALAEEGFNLSLSLLLRTVSEARWWSKIYLDMVDHSVVYLDRSGEFRRIREGMSRWMKTHHARKESYHGLPVWRYPLDQADVDLLELSRVTH